jgi:predicted metal-dependent hydrolase
MQFELVFGPSQLRSADEHWLRVGAACVRLWFCPNHRARRYVLRLRPDGSARVTIPRGGAVAEARRFVERNVLWLERQLLRQAAQLSAPKAWNAGTEILFRGEYVRLEISREGAAEIVRLGDVAFKAQDCSGDMRPRVQSFLWGLAARELPSRVFELAAVHRVRVSRVTVRNQRSRWGSCSRRGTISLNWRLVQAPLFVRDYIILHELAHLKEMNHSRRFWREVARLCPDFARAERWLKANSELLR